MSYQNRIYGVKSQKVWLNELRINSEKEKE